MLEFLSTYLDGCQGTGRRDAARAGRRKDLIDAGTDDAREAVLVSVL